MAASTSARRRFDFGGNFLVCCLPDRSARKASAGCAHIQIASCIWTTFFVKIKGETHYLWRTVDRQGEVLEGYVSVRRDHKAVLKFTSKSMKRNGQPRTVVTDKLRSYRAGIMINGNIDRQEIGRWLNYRAENFHLLFTRLNWAMQKFRRAKTLLKSVSRHASI